MLVFQSITQFCVNEHEENCERRDTKQLDEGNCFRTCIGNNERIFYVFQTIVIEQRKKQYESQGNNFF